MDRQDVPQETNATLGGIRKAVYARGADGRIVPVESAGWEPEEIVTLQAVAVFREQAEAARARFEAGQAAPLEYWMYHQRMDLATFAQVTGVWRWRIRRHFRPAVFARLSARLLARYADALGITLEQLRRGP
jgi:hypothetical protein